MKPCRKAIRPRELKLIESGQLYQCSDCGYYHKARLLTPEEKRENARLSSLKFKRKIDRELAATRERSR